MNFPSFPITPCPAIRVVVVFWSLFQRSSGRGGVTPWTIPQFIAGPHWKRCNHQLPHTQAQIYRQFTVPNLELLQDFGQWGEGNSQRQTQEPEPRRELCLGGREVQCEASEPPPVSLIANWWHVTWSADRDPCRWGDMGVCNPTQTSDPRSRFHHRLLLWWDHKASSQITSAGL